ncbi:MAG TPA: HupE/UreJ family protein [Sphingomonas sp.]
MSSSITRVCALLLGGVLLASGPARADVFNLGEFDFAPGETPGTYHLTATIPESVANDRPLGLPGGCRQVSRDRIDSAIRAQISIQLDCDHAPGPDDAIVTPWPVDGASFENAAAGTFQKQAIGVENGTVSLPIGIAAAQARSLGAVAGAYLREGVFHILGGWDHLAFVLCLCLLTSGRRLLILITTFTLGHSVSLALAFFHVIAVPAPPVEAVIALSIAFMAREALRSNGAFGAELGRYMVVVVAFGLLHGLGFASALKELGVAPAERVSGLVFFNIGVEIGQLLFVGVVLTLMAGLRRLGGEAIARRAALYGAGSLGSFWMIARVAAILGLVAAV